MRVLIVDDSSVMRKIVERSLRQADLPLEQVFDAANGADALDILRREKVELILSDINMPVMDGLEFVRQISEQKVAPGTPIVMITTEGSEAHVRQAIAGGAQGYIRKPFTPEQVREHVTPLIAVQK